MSQKNDGIFPALRLALRSHPKLISTAGLLGIPRPYILGVMVNWWCGAFKHAEDGDMWQGDEERSNRFILSLSEMPEKQMEFLDALRQDHWLNGWLIHDWLDYVGPHLYAQYKTHQRQRLVRIWAKHGRRYGREPVGTREENQGVLRFENRLDAVGQSVGCERDVVGLSPGCNLKQPLTLNNPIALNSYTLKQKEIKSPKGGLGENDAIVAGLDEKGVVLNSVGKGTVHDYFSWKSP